MISFALSEEQEIARAAVAEFARVELTPAARGADEAAAFSESLIATWGLGLVRTVAEARAAPVEQPTVMNALLLEEVAYGDSSVAVGPLGFAKAIAEQGSDAQQREWLPFHARDEPRFAAIAHRDAGWFQGAGKSTRAQRVAGGWRLEGAKALIPLATRCCHFPMTAECEGARAALIVSAAQSEVRIAPAKGTLGLRALEMADVAFENVFVADGARLGESAGADVQRIIDLSRVALGAILGGPALHQRARRAWRGDREKAERRLQTVGHAYRDPGDALDGAESRRRARRGPDGDPQRAARSTLQRRPRAPRRRRGRADFRRPRLRPRSARATRSETPCSRSRARRSNMRAGRTRRSPSA
jgi:alkylation response protein AidB-like acyl-CoA dehydrogenase